MGNLRELVTNARRVFKRERRDQDSPQRPLVLRRYFPIFKSSFFAEGIPRSQEAGLCLDDMLSDIAGTAGLDHEPVAPETVLSMHSIIVAMLSEFDEAYGVGLMWPCYAPLDAPDVVFLPQDLSADGLAHFSWQSSLDQLGDEPPERSDAYSPWKATVTALHSGYHCAFQDLADRCSGELRSAQGLLTETQLAALSIGLCLVALEVIGVRLCSPQVTGKASTILDKWLPVLQRFWSPPEEEEKKVWWKKGA